MFFLYDITVLLLSPFIGAVMLIYRRGRVKLKERFGFWGPLKTGEYIWFHGASRGEVKGLLPLVKEMRRSFPKHKFLLTTVSPSGLDGVGDLVDLAKLLPFDSRIFLTNAVGSLKITHFISAEVELWPALIKFIKARGAKMYLINARKPLRSYPWTTALFAKYDRIFSGVKGSSKYKYLGNTKYDQEPKQFPIHNSEGRFVVTLGSLRVGEEKFLFPAIKQHPETVFIIAPRHREKDKYFAEQLTAYGIVFKRRTEGGELGEGVLLLDNFGELEEAYSISDLVFIGGTLVDIGGHNPYEAVMYRVPIAVGPYTYKIKDAVEELRDGNALYVIKSAEAWDKLLAADREQFQIAGQNGFNVWSGHCGAARKITEIIKNDFAAADLSSSDQEKEKAQR